MTRQINCPSCGGPLKIESAFTTTLVCSYCGASLLVSDTEVDITGKTAKLADYPSRFTVGGDGTVKGRKFHVLGRVRYQNSDGFWDDWFVEFDNQQPGWITEDEGNLTLGFKSRLTTPLPPLEQVHVGTYIPFGKDRLFVSEKDQAHVLGGEGQLSGAFTPGKALQYLAGNAGNRAMRILWQENGIELYTGDPLEFNDVKI
ncbi:MAG: DUF4178 domain-containing protein [Anaerolineae bacterium]